MAQKLDHMDLKQILRLHIEGLSNRKIGTTLGISRNTVNTYMTLFKASETPLKELLHLDALSLEGLFPAKTTIVNERYDRLMKYFEGVNLARNYAGFTFLFHYNDYKNKELTPYSYTQFMEHYNRKFRKVNSSMKLEHLAGEELMIDFAGKHLYVTDKETGEQKSVEVFVAILPCSHYTYVEACWSQKREDLINCLVHSLDYYSGVPKAIISDNLKSAVSRSSKHEPQINKSLKDFAHHYDCVINPTRSYSPQDKALVEHAVKLAYQRIYYPLREMTFFSLEDLNYQILILLQDYNDCLMQTKGTSRRERFQSIERSTLKSLPETSYEMKNYCRAKVQKMGYVFFSTDKSYYSVPYRYIGQSTQIHYTDKYVEVYYKHERIAFHLRNKSKGIYNTIEEHLSTAHQAYNQWSPLYFKNMAKPHGIDVIHFVEQLIAQADYPQTAYKRAMGVIQLHKEYGSDRLNNACARAIYGQTLSYNRVKNILKNNLDKEYLDLKNLESASTHIPSHNNIRGPQAFN